MDNQLIPAEELITQVQHLKKTLDEQIELRSGQGLSDQRLIIMSKALNTLKLRALLSPAMPVEQDNAAGIGYVVKKSGAYGPVSPSPGSTTPTAEIGTIIKQSGSVKPAAANNLVQTAEGFRAQLQGLTAEQLGSSRFSKTTLLQMVEKLNADGAGIEVNATQSKAAIAEEIINHLNQ